MPDESGEVQNTGEETPAAEQPQVGEEKTEQPKEETPQEETPQEEVQPEEDKRDWKAATFKYKKLYEELKPKAQNEKVESEEVPNPEKQAEELLRGIMREEIAPVVQGLETVKRDEIVTEIARRPYAGNFTDEIIEVAKTLPSHLSFSERMDRAYKDVISDNLAKIVETNRKAGIDEGYSNKTVKQGLNTSLGATPSTVGKETPKGVLETLESGSFTPEWYTEHREEIVKERNKTLGE